MQPDEIKTALDRIEIGQQNVLGRLERVENRFDLLDDRARQSEAKVAVLQDRSDALQSTNNNSLVASLVSLLGMVVIGLVKFMDWVSSR
jgi:cytoskeletal protein RodZ